MKEEIPVKKAIEYTAAGQTKHTDKRGSGQFQYTDWVGRTLKLQQEELTASEEACEGHRVEASVGLPDPGSEAALLVVQAVMEAMELHYDYELTAKPTESGA